MILTRTRMIVISVSQRKQAIAIILFWFLCTRKANNFATSMVTAFTMYLLWSVDPSVINDPSTNMRFLQTAKRVSHFFKTLFYSFILQYFMFLLILFTLHVARSSFVHLWHAISSIKKKRKKKWGRNQTLPPQQILWACHTATASRNQRRHNSLTATPYRGCLLPSPVPLPVQLTAQLRRLIVSKLTCHGSNCKYGGDRAWKARSVWSRHPTTFKHRKICN